MKLNYNVAVFVSPCFIIRLSAHCVAHSTRRRTLNLNTEAILMLTRGRGNLCAKSC